MNQSRQQYFINSYSSQLTSRFYSNSMALQVLISLILVLMLVVEIIKFGKKTYEWQTEYQVNLQSRVYDESKSNLKDKPQIEIDNQNQDRRKPAAPDQHHENSMVRQHIKKQVYIPPIVMIQDIVKNKVPQLAIIAVNIVMLSTFEYMTISAYITIVLITISEILGLRQAQHINLKFILDIISKLLMLSWYINQLSVSKPSFQ